MYVLYADSDCDITPESAKRMGYKTIISMPFSIDGENFYPYKDMTGFDLQSFYKKLNDGVMPKTSSINVEEYKEYFEKEFSQGNDIFYIHFSQAMSMTFQNMREAYKELQAKYPDRKLYEADTKGITVISYALLEEAAEQYKKGLSAEELLKWFNENVDKWAMYLFADNLQFFKRSGRVSGLTATMGTLLGIRPLIWMTPEGKMESFGTARGRQKAINTLVDKVLELGDDLENHKIYIGHTMADECVELAVEALREKLGDKITIEQIVTNPTAGSHCGPNSMGIAFHAKHK